MSSSNNRLSHIIPAHQKTRTWIMRTNKMRVMIERRVGESFTWRNVK